MSAKLFGLVLFVVGITIATYYNLWVLFSTPYMTKERQGWMGSLFPPAILLFQLPALALAGGITLIALFILKTEAAIAAKKREAAKAK